MNKKLIANVFISIEATSQQVWNALVNPDAIRQSMYSTHVVSDWREGGQIVWQGIWQGNSFVDRGVILKLVPGHTLQYNFFNSLSGLPDKPENHHTVTIELSANKTGTHVSLTQDNNADDTERAHYEELWKMMLANLKKLIEEAK